MIAKASQPHKLTFAVATRVLQRACRKCSATVTADLEQAVWKIRPMMGEKGTGSFHELHTPQVRKDLDYNKAFVSHADCH